MLLRNGSNRRDDYRACFKQFKQPKPRTRPLNTVSLKFVKRLDFPRILCSGGLDAFLWLKRVHFIFRYKSRTKLPLTVYFGSLPHTFDKFESWHQSVRQTQLKAKYDGPAKQIFRDLKKTVKNTPDSFLTASSFEILAVDPESDQVHLEEVVCPHASSYELDGQKICPANFDGVVLTLPPGTNAEVGSVLTQQVFSHEIADLHQTLMDFWRPRWQKQSSIPPEQWVRVVSFTRAYMPSLQLHLAPLTLADWRLGLLTSFFQDNADLVGLSADLQKAFNNIGRAQLQFWSEHLGLPEELRTPWFGFLGHFERRFDIRGCVSQPLLSTEGLPEGCPLSIIGMLLLNWAHHTYMRHYAPATIPRTYVDNLTLLAARSSELMHGFACTAVFYRTWGLDIDDDKTYTWGTTTASRAELRLLPHQHSLAHRELGGFLQFTRKKDYSPLRERLLQLLQLEEWWTRLAKSPAPFPHKLHVLHSKFWAAGLHGTTTCLAPDTLLNLFPLVLRFIGYDIRTS
ncbi:unnamed protein product [Durusdinium trenchii]|uniref:Uncharacterized protein n=2 Tax=Durusdinium trenchii TaxID=1381693 RepID=A0ABP0NSZ2_9DINO